MCSLRSLPDRKSNTHHDRDDETDDGSFDEPDAELEQKIVFDGIIHSILSMVAASPLDIEPPAIHPALQLGVLTRYQS